MAQLQSACWFCSWREAQRQNPPPWESNWAQSWVSLYWICRGWAFPSTDTLLRVICSSSMPDVVRHTGVDSISQRYSTESLGRKSNLDLPRLALATPGAALFVETSDSRSDVAAGFSCCIGRGAAFSRGLYLGRWVCRDTITLGLSVLKARSSYRHVALIKASMIHEQPDASL